MVEVLIAILLLGVGLLGLANLQMLGLRNNQSAFHRSLALHYAMDMAERIRANPAGDYHLRSGGTADCINSVCTPAQMVGYDMTQWSNSLATQLPMGVGVVCRDADAEDDPDGDGVFNSTPVAPSCDGLAASPYAVKIWWDDNRSGTLNQRFALNVQP